MKRSGRVNWSELRVGMVVLFAFAVLLWASFTGSGFSVFRKTESLTAYFPEVGGLVAGAPVWMAGMEVGHVERVIFVEVDGLVRVRVDFRIMTKHFSMLNTDAKAAIGTMGLMGDRFLDIRLGGPGFPAVKPGDILEAALAPDLTAAFAGAPGMMDQLGETLDELTEMMSRINRGEGFLGALTTNSKTSANLDSLMVSADELMSGLNTSQKKLLASLTETSDRLNVLLAKMDSGDGSLARLVNDTTLYHNLSAMSRRADNLFKKLDEGEGSAGRFLAEDQVYNDVRGLLSEVQDLIADIKAHPKKYFKVSVF